MDSHTTVLNSEFSLKVYYFILFLSTITKMYLYGNWLHNSMCYIKKKYIYVYDNETMPFWFYAELMHTNFYKLTK